MTELTDPEVRFRTVESVEDAREVLGRLEHGVRMLEYVVRGDGLLAGSTDVVRPYPNHGDKMQVEISLLGRVHWIDADEIARDISEKGLEVRVVEWEDRFQ